MLESDNTEVSHKLTFEASFSCKHLGATGFTHCNTTLPLKCLP